MLTGRAGETEYKAGEFLQVMQQTGSGQVQKCFQSGSNAGETGQQRRLNPRRGGAESQEGTDQQVREHIITVGKKWKH